jgi:RNA polymerase sigma factor (sigma-70 family)
MTSVCCSATPLWSLSRAPWSIGRWTPKQRHSSQIGLWEEAANDLRVEGRPLPSHRWRLDGARSLDGRRGPAWALDERRFDRHVNESMRISPLDRDVGKINVRPGLGDEVGDLYRSEGDRLWRAVYAFAGDRELAADAVAEAFAQCIQRGEAVRSPKNWVWRTAFRIAAGELKERRRWTQLDVEPGYVTAEDDDALREALRSLPERQRAALILRHYEGYDARGIGDILGCNAATVRVHLHRGTKRLKELLEERDD